MISRINMFTKRAVLGAEYGPLGTSNRNYSTYLPMHERTIPSRATAYQIENDAYTDPVTKAKLLYMIDTASDGRPGLISVKGLTNAGVGAGLGYAAASLSGKVLGGVFGGLPPSIYKRLQQAGIVGGILMNTGLLKTSTVSELDEKSGYSAGLSVKDAYRSGFLLKLAELGVPLNYVETGLDCITQRSGITKSAKGFTELAKSLGAALVSGGKGLLGLLTGGAVLIPGVLGWEAAKRKRFSDADAEAYRDLSLIQEYKDATDQIKDINEERDAYRPKRLKVAAMLPAQPAAPAAVPLPATVPSPSRPLDPRLEAAKEKLRVLNAARGNAKPLPKPPADRRRPV